MYYNYNYIEPFSIENEPNHTSFQCQSQSPYPYSGKKNYKLFKSKCPCPNKTTLIFNSEITTNEPIKQKPNCCKSKKTIYSAISTIKQIEKETTKPICQEYEEVCYYKNKKDKLYCLYNNL